ncbi:metallophosphoesterase family protein [candidate division KSB1 bacterium]|nr:metallophosphoesterase family protein [candidate division KSB1 bacterium]
MKTENFRLIRWQWILSVAVLIGFWAPRASAQSHLSNSGPSWQVEGGFLKEPYLSQVTETSIVISWETPQAIPSVVHYGPTPDCELVYEDGNPAFRHSVEIDDLEPSRKYYYSVEAQTEQSPLASFWTAVPLGSTFTFAVYGDTRTNYAVHERILEQILRFRPCFAFHVGDLVADGRKSSDWHKYFEIVGPKTHFGANIPIYYAVGNHEYPRESSLYYDHFYLPTNSLEGNEKYYSFDYGGIHFISLNSEIEFKEGSKQTQWLRQDLEKVREVSTHIFVFLHRPPYSCGPHGPEMGIQKTWCPLFEEYGVDLVFCGHDHIYERTRSINRVIYVVTGGGGAPLYEINPKEWTAYAESVHHFCLITVSSEGYQLKMIRIDGSVGDEYAGR